MPACSAPAGRREIEAAGREQEVLEEGVEAKLRDAETLLFENFERLEAMMAGGCGVEEPWKRSCGRRAGGAGGGSGDRVASHRDIVV